MPKIKKAKEESVQPTQITENQQPKAANPLEKVAQMAAQAKNVDMDDDAEPKSLSAVQVEKTLRLGAEIQLTAKELELFDEKAKTWGYMEQLLQKEKALVEKNIELLKLQRQLTTLDRREYVNRKDTKQKEYQIHSANLSKALGVDFSKCAFDPATGAIEIMS